MSLIDDAILQIETFIIANGNKEITANVLRPLLVGLADAVQNTTGDPAGLNTVATKLVEAINEVRSIAVNGGGLNIINGTADPNITDPAGAVLGSYYAWYSGSTLLGFYQFNGYNWIEII